MAVGVNIVSTFDSKGISRAIKDFQKIEGAGNKATFGLRTFDKGMTNTLATVGKLAAGVAVAAGAIGFKLASAAYESQKVMAQTEAIIKATGGAAGITATQVAKLSTQLSMQIGVDDELIQKSANLLLTFKQIQNQVGEGNQVFDRAVTAAQDLGSVFGSADAAAMQLGKALSNPVKGITALNRAGVNFTDQQKEQIKTLVASGDVLGAQKIILAEVEAQVGGTAAATATGFDRMKIAVGNVAEEFGAILIPYIEKFADFVTNKVVPYLTNLADVIGQKGLGAGIKMLAGDFVNLTTNMGAFGNTLLALAAIFTTIRLVTIAATISQNLFNVALLSNPIGIVIASVIALTVAAVALYMKFEIVRKVINSVINFIIGIIENWLNAWITVINGIITGINLLIKAANFFGAGLQEIGKIGEVEFGRIGTAAQGARKQIGSVAEVAGAMAEKEGGVQKVVKALNAVSTAAGGAGGGGGAAKSVETAKEKLQKYIDALKGMSSAQKSARDADKSLMKSRSSLAEATTKLTDAQAYFNQVVAGYGANSKQAKDRQLALRKAQAAVERAGYDVETSVFAVTKAEQELAAVRLDPESSPQAIREAEIALAESKLSVKDATDAQVEATDALTEAEILLNEAINGAKEGSDAYTEAVDKLNDAKKAQADAENSVTEAIERQIEAVERLAEAEQKARDARVGVKPVDATTAETQVGVKPSPASAGGFGSFMEAVRGLHPNSQALKSSTPVTDARKQFPKLYAEYKAKGLAMAQGGIITKPTQLLAGEAGAEAIIPLDKLQSGMTVNVTINAGMGTDPAKLGDEIVDVLTRYQRRNGALPLKVA
ncbi:Bacteriophage lambda, GpH, tail tape measure, N-terminal [uncultured Caudovirales phage]|uniref:Bacteriophage lambda, GpH, tail tape measure, N-terminal n=1 Tax=uncultured Caudovirales phage TaxID=2100421 RepID=A0A6J5NIA2_9CAUD|nr:Bacteriophage lambda, GpH, tail tape measure, N-terminal [uncultured Caudovirales phage]